MDLRLIGYFPKNPSVPAGWTGPAHIAAIGSVSACLAEAPDGWIQRWLHNDLGLFNTRADARSVIPENAPGFSIFAYRLLTVRFATTGPEPLPVAEFPVEPIPASFVALGFDVGSRSLSSFFECSPLSCNLMAREIPVNEFCLLSNLDQAIAAAERFAQEQPEPGSYYVVEVFADQGSTGTKAP